MKTPNPITLGIEPIFSKIEAAPVEPKPSEELEDISEEHLEDDKYLWKEGHRCPFCRIRVVKKEYLDVHGNRKGKNRAISQWKGKDGRWVFNYQTRIYCNCGKEEIVIPPNGKSKRNF